jgi:hypothetical protein
VRRKPGWTRPGWTAFLFNAVCRAGCASDSEGVSAAWWGKGQRIFVTTMTCLPMSMLGLGIRMNQSLPTHCVHVGMTQCVTMFK